MKQNQDLSALQQADPEQIAEHVPAIDEHHAEKLFVMSEAKYRKYYQTEEAPAQAETSPVETIRKPRWIVNVAAVAACFVVCAGAVGGVASLKRPDIRIVEVQETAAPETVSPADEVIETAVSEKTETQVTTPSQKAEAPEILSIVPEPVQTSAIRTETAPVTTEIIRTTQEIIMTETRPVLSAEVQETELLPEEPEEIIMESPTEPLISIETEVILPETEPVIMEEETTTEAETTPVAGPLYDTIPFERSAAGLSALPDDTAPTAIDTKYAPAYLPEHYQLRLESLEESANRPPSDDQTAPVYDYYTTWYQDPSYRTCVAYRHIIFFTQETKNTFALHDIVSEQISPITVNGRSGADLSMQEAGTYRYVWDNGDYIFTLCAVDVPFEEFLQIAESVRPVE